MNLEHRFALANRKMKQVAPYYVSPVCIKIKSAIIFRFLLTTRLICGKIKQSNKHMYILRIKDWVCSVDFFCFVAVRDTF